MKEIGSNKEISDVTPGSEVSDKTVQENEYISEDDVSGSDYKEMSDNEIDTATIDENDDQMEDLEGDSPHLPKNHGEWEGERGNSKWIPEDEYVPKQKNPEGESWSEIKQNYDFDGVEFNDNKPDFSDFSRGEVQIDDFGADRYKNFSQADVKEAEKRGCDPKDVKNWREANDYTWHETNDCSTMQKVPSVIHNNVPHSGGVSEFKNDHKNTMEEF